MPSSSTFRAFVVSVSLSASLSSYGFNSKAVQAIPTAGANCYFTALTVNSLLAVPAMMISAESAALLFLNPALCEKTDTPNFGDLGLEEDRPAFRIKEIFHVFTFLTGDQRFEKASPYEFDPFTFVSTPSHSASRFVHCHPMQTWIDESISQLPKPFVQLNEEITAVEAVIDSREKLSSHERFVRLNSKMQRLTKAFGNPMHLIQAALAERLLKEGISTTPVPSQTSNEFYQFVNAHPKMIKDQSIFGYMWLSSRMDTINYIFENYKYLGPAKLLP